MDMAIKRFFKGIIDYPSKASFSNVSSDYQYQPDNKTRYSHTGKVLTLEEAFENIGHVQPIVVVEKAHQ